MPKATSPKLQPSPQNTRRRSFSIAVKKNAATLREDFDIPAIVNNGELAKYWPQVPATFSKGLNHDAFGIVSRKASMMAFVEFINQTRDDKLFPNLDPVGAALKPKGRVWESPLAGHVYDLEGPDAGDLTIPPAPALGSGELAAEMAEIYAFALLRDYPFEVIQSGDTPPDAVAKTLKKLRSAKGKAKKYSPPAAAIVNSAVKAVGWFNEEDQDDRAEKRRDARSDSSGNLTDAVLYRGSTEGAKAGPYISQFMLIGNASRGPKNNGTPAYSESKSDAGHLVCPSIDSQGVARKVDDGIIVYGAQEIDQRVISHEIGVDYMTNWTDWLDVQNGVDKRDGDSFEKGRRFITTPRDLATYVHYDQLYQAYLNACLLMLNFKFPFDSGLPKANSKVRDAFATFGGPHILSLVTEVASRALKHARRQKFNTHLRARPEVIAAMLTLSANGKGDKLGVAEPQVAATHDVLEAAGLLGMVDARNDAFNKGAAGNKDCKITHNYLLPMAFPEGSPMHPSYAAGHATVAGACVTILKAFFEMYETKNGWKPKKFDTLYGDDKDDIFKNGFISGIFLPTVDGISLRQLQPNEVNGPVTVLGELDKLAANISIGRDMAGVHYYTDYYESLRLGERIAVGILQEQMLTYPEETQMRLHTFDGERMTIHGNGNGNDPMDGDRATVDVAGTTFEEWFTRID